MAEAQRRQDASLHLADLQRFPQPHQGLRLWFNGFVHAVQGSILRQLTVLEHINQAANLEECGTTLSVTCQGLLGDDEHRVRDIPTQVLPQHGVQLGFIGIVRIGGGIVLAHHPNIIRGEAQGPQRLDQPGILTATAGTQGTQARSRDRGVSTVGIGLGVRHHGIHRQAEFLGHAAARQDHRAATFGLQETATPLIVGPGDEPGVNALGVHGRGLRGGIHVTEAGQGFNLHVINATSNHHIGLAQANLVHALFHGNRSGSTSGNRVDHLTIATHIGLHHVSRNHIGQGLLQNIAGASLAQEAGDKHLVQAFHATNTGALGGGHITRMHGLQQFGGAEAGGQEGVDGGHQVPHGNAVKTIEHCRRNPPPSRVKTIRHLAGNRTGQGSLARHPGNGTLQLADHPFTIFIAVNAGAFFIGRHIVAGLCLGVHHEFDLPIQEDRGNVDRALTGEEVLIGEFPNAGTGNHFVTEAIVNVFLGNSLVVGIIPGGGWVFLPGEQAHHPGEFEHTCGSQVDGTIAVDTKFGFVAGAPRAPGADFAHTNDDHHVVQVLGDVIGVDGCRLLVPDGGGQGLDGRWLVFFIRRFAGAFETCGQLWQRDLGVGKPAGEVRIQRRNLSVDARLAGNQGQQLIRNFVRMVDVDALGFGNGHQGVIATHEVGTGDPPNVGVRQGDLFRPTLLHLPLVDHGVERGLHFTVRTIATKGTAVGRTRQHHMYSAVFLQRSGTGDEALQAPEQQPGLVFLRGTGIGQQTIHLGCREGEEQRGDQRRLGHLGGAAHRSFLFGSGPRNQGVRVPEAGQVSGH